MSINLWQILVSPESVGRHVAELTGPCRYTGLYGESLKGNWSWYFNFCLMNVGGNKGRNGGEKGRKKRTEWGRLGGKVGKKEGKSNGRNQDQSLLHPACTAWVLHESHKSTMSLTDTHFSEHTHDIINGTRLASGLAVFLCYSKAALGPLSVGTQFFLLMLEKQSNGQFHTVLVPARNRNSFMHFNKDKGRSWFLIIGFKASESKVFRI